MSTTKDRMPSSVTEHLNFFDRFATRVGRLVSRAPFFAAAVIVVVAWLLEGLARILILGPHAFLEQSYQLQINTVTTVITFLLVALLQNTEARDSEAIQEKLNAIADGLSHLMDSVAADESEGDLRDAINELRDAVGLEEIVGADDQAQD